MILALVTYRIYPTLMGGQKGVALFYQHLQQHFLVLLAVSKNNKLAEKPIVPAQALLYPNRKMVLNLFRIDVLKKLVRRQPVQVVIAEHSYAGWIAWLLKRSTGLPFIIHSHNLEAIRFRHMQRWWWKGYLFYEKWVHQKADFNFFISEEDKKYALKHFKLLPDRCAAITYGAEPYIQKSNGERQLFLQELDISETCCLFFFNGTMDYRPNYEAVQILMEEVAPRLRMKHLNFKILLSGNRISSELRKQIEEHPDFHFLDYATDVNLIYQSAQLFLNPMPFASGVKTKVIEAIGNQSTVISTVSGATGLNKQACGPKLITVADGDWDGFVQCIMELMVQPFTPTPLSFWEQYAWDRIVQKAAVALNNVIHPHAAH